MNIIAPPPDRSAECREVITGAFAVIEARRAGTYYAGPKHLEVLSKPHTKAKKEAAQRLGSALRRLRYVVNTNKDELDFYLSLFPDIDQIDKWIRQCDEVKRAPAPRRARDEPWKRQAAQLAFVLLRAFSGSKILMLLLANVRPCQPERAIRTRLLPVSHRCTREQLN